ncbi:hypothetical protein BDY21DRAFT_113044 [Lineolata rhizophorae]|uniref:Uncharacterized protein n=1 Tax=Lineolata rhizophorae TaxID=578093 RepID=A0A6A6NRD9_9PEZI|nr:hypothetical protein BDY21DRAFT_113044 [Lineolata rhizophorae]
MPVGSPRSKPSSRGGGVGRGKGPYGIAGAASDAPPWRISGRTWDTFWSGGSGSRAAAVRRCSYRSWSCLRRRGRRRRRDPGPAEAAAAVTARCGGASRPPRSWHAAALRAALAFLSFAFRPFAARDCAGRERRGSPGAQPAMASRGCGADRRACCDAGGPMKLGAGL